MEQGEIILYKPDNSLSLEVRIESDTVWLTQQQIADLFGTRRQAISKHLKNIFETDEMSEPSVCSILEHTAADGKTYATKFYNLDAIISAGYRVNSKNATAFRRWANTILKDYLLKGYSISRRFRDMQPCARQISYHRRDCLPFGGFAEGFSKKALRFLQNGNYRRTITEPYTSE